MTRRIVVGVDFSEASRKALDEAAELARELGVPLLAIHALEPPAPLYSTVELPLLDPAWVSAVEQEADRQLKAWLQPYAAMLSAYAGAEGRVQWGRPGELLVNASDPGTLLVVGQAGESALRRVLIGSTAAAVARHAPCDVLVVPAGT